MHRLPFGRRALVAFIVLPVAALVAGLATMGASAQRPREGVLGGGCVQKALRFGVTDDPAEVARQRAFEARSTAVTAPGLYSRPVPSTPTLHAASHGFVVVFHRPDLPGGSLRALRALVAAAVATKAPVIVAPRVQRNALVALGEGSQLTCAAGAASQAREVRAFAAGIYASLKA